jgi:hypothetical protein
LDPEIQTNLQRFYHLYASHLVRCSEKDIRWSWSAPLMIAGDFNIHMDDAKDADAGKLLDILVSHSLLQHVGSPTHRKGHTHLLGRNDRASIN